MSSGRFCKLRHFSLIASAGSFSRSIAPADTETSVSSTFGSRPAAQRIARPKRSCQVS